MKTGLAELEAWLLAQGDAWVGFAWEELRYIRQAVQLLVIHQKSKKSLHEITSDLCPVLSIQQLYRISTMYWDDKCVDRPPAAAQPGRRRRAAAGRGAGTAPRR